MIPGLLAVVRAVGGGFNGRTTEVEQNLCFVVVNSQTEHYLGKDRVEVQFSSALRRDQFFTSRSEAEQLAAEYHDRKCPNPAYCGWSA